MSTRASSPSYFLFTTALGVASIAGTLALCESEALAVPGYVRSTAGAPWGSTSNEDAMNLVFGAGGWDDLRYETVDVGMLLSPVYTFLYLEGSDNNALELEAFLMANQATLEAWVDAGGTLFLNAAPNEGGVQNWGFGGITLNYSDSADAGTAVDPTHPIWNEPFLPVALMFTGGSYAHASVSGPGLVPHIIDANGGNPNLGELDWGSGRIMVGGLTTSNFWDPLPESHNLRANIIAYLAAGDGDVDGLDDFEDNCPANFNPMQEDEDGDDVGDLCDGCPGDPGNDPDFDTVCAAVDNCLAHANPLQENADLDALGDPCDPCPGDVGNDPDLDELCAAVDNCPEAYNPAQIDQDLDGIGAVCDICPLDADDDGDGDLLCSNEDNCPAIANAGQEDADMDDVGDVCDACPDDDDQVADEDMDGLCAADDNCPDDANDDQADADRDGAGDACDACPDDATDDVDSDGVCGGMDNCPDIANTDQADLDGDGTGDACDSPDETSGAGTDGVDETGDGTGTDETGSEPGTTGSEPGTGDESGDGATGGTDTEAEADTGLVDNASGCACSSRPAGGSTWWLALLLGARLRRRRAA
jgi:MYXO-CTERM domain-containing protein